MARGVRWRTQSEAADTVVSEVGDVEAPIEFGHVGRTAEVIGSRACLPSGADRGLWVQRRWIEENDAVVEPIDHRKLLAYGARLPMWPARRPSSSC